MNAPQSKPQSENVVEQLDLAIERAELVHALGRISDRIHEIRQTNSNSPDIEILRRTEKSLQQRLEVVRRKREQREQR